MDQGAVKHHKPIHKRESPLALWPPIALTPLGAPPLPPVAPEWPKTAEAMEPVTVMGVHKESPPGQGDFFSGWLHRPLRSATVGAAQQLPRHGRLCSDSNLASIVAGSTTWLRWGEEMPATMHRKTACNIRAANNSPEPPRRAWPTRAGNEESGKWESGKVSANPGLFPFTPTVCLVCLINDNL